MRRALRKLWNDQSGTAAIEYPLLMALIAVGMIGVLMHFEGSVTQLPSTVAGHVSPLAAVAAPAAPPAPDPDPDDD